MKENDTTVDLDNLTPAHKQVANEFLDRIDSSQGYTPDNIRFVCAAVNNAMMHWGEAMFAELAVGYVLKKYGVHPAAQAMQAAMVEKQEPGMAKEFPQNKNDSAE